MPSVARRAARRRQKKGSSKSPLIPSARRDDWASAAEQSEGRRKGSSQATTHERQRDRYDPTKRDTPGTRITDGWQDEREPGAEEDPFRRTGKDAQPRNKRVAHRWRRRAICLTLPYAPPKFRSLYTSRRSRSPRRGEVEFVGSHNP